MTDEGFWTCPPDREVHGWGDYTITVVHPPFPTSADPSTLATITTLEPHDPARAREFAETFGTVDAVRMSAFRVRHTKYYTALMEEIWRFQDDHGIPPEPEQPGGMPALG